MICYNVAKSIGHPVKVSVTCRLQTNRSVAANSCFLYLWLHIHTGA